MSLLIATTSTRYRRYDETPWNSRYDMCVEDPRNNCYYAIKELIFKPYFDYIHTEFPEYIVKNPDHLYLRNRYGSYNVCWQQTSLEEVNKRIRIYK